MRERPSKGARRRRAQVRARSVAGSEGCRRPQQERSRYTWDAILEAAEKLLVERGYARSSTNAIAARAGVSVGSLYQYFPSKEAVYQQVLARHQAAVRPIEERALHALTTGGVGLGHAMTQAMTETLALHARDPALMRALDGELAAVAARWGKPAKHDLGIGTTHVAQLLNDRFGLPPEEAMERAWLALEVLEQVGRSLVHDALRGLDRERVVRLTVETLARMLEAPPRAAPPQ